MYVGQEKDGTSLPELVVGDRAQQKYRYVMIQKDPDPLPDEEYLLSIMII